MTEFPVIYTYYVSFYCYPYHGYLHSFPTRRSSDLFSPSAVVNLRGILGTEAFSRLGARAAMAARAPSRENASDRKSTRLNSSHANISYAVFCLKKKNRIMNLRTGIVK